MIPGTQVIMRVKQSKFLIYFHVLYFSFWYFTLFYTKVHTVGLNQVVQWLPFWRLLVN